MKKSPTLQGELPIIPDLDRPYSIEEVAQLMREAYDLGRATRTPEPLEHVCPKCGHTENKYDYAKGM
ncbi:MAG: hypothetical protein M0R80_25765 [Proteobacteria bacterium]|jgi:hypothetical protein|nr:hypothetical protein [Pseudomonadota bacterium]